MSIIEDRVVRATFDNSGFDSKVNESTRSIENFEKAVEGKDFSGSFNPLIAALASAQQGFSKLEIVAMGVLTNIATKAVEAGEQLLKSFTIDPITQGFSKYETYTDSIQTVMAATGKSMEEIEGYMEKLSWFSDETSYSLTDMTSNIGKFTAAGVDLDKSVTAMIGISNLAAISGQRSAEAARVMYNASQALGQGYMAAIDWKSIENANMATMEFKQILIDTAVEMGTVQKAGEDLENTYVAVGIEAKDIEKHYFNATSMRNNLSDKWLTGDVFVKALENYGKFSEQVYDLYTEMNDTLGEEKLTTEILDDIKLFAGSTDDELKALGYSSENAIKLFRELSEQVGSLGNRAFLTAQETKTFTDMVGALQDATSTAWSKVYEAIFGNYVEAKEFWSELVEQLYDLAVVPVQGIVSRLKEWKKIGGRDDFLQGIKNSLQVIQNLVDHITGAFREIFPKKSAEQLKSATEKFKDFTQKLVDLTSVIAKIKEPIEEVIDKVEDAGEIVEEAIEPVSDALEAVADTVEEVIENVDVETVARGIDKLMTGFKGLLTVVKMAFDAIAGIFKMVSGDAVNVGSGILGKIVDWIGRAGQWLIDLRQELIDSGDYKAIFGVFNDLYTEIKRVFTEIRDFVVRVYNDIFGESEEAADRFGLVHKALFGLYTVIDWITEKVRNFNPLGKLLELYSTIDIQKVTDGLTNAKNVLSGLAKTIGGKLKEEVPKVLTSIANAFSSLWTKISSWDWQGYIQDKINGFIRVIDKLKDGFKRSNISGMFGSVFNFILRLVDAVKTFADTFDFSDIIVKAVDMITAVFTQARKIIDKVNIAKLVSNTTNIISHAFEQLRKIVTKVDFSGLVEKGIGVLTSVTGQIKNFMKRADFAGFANGVVSVLSGLGTQVKRILDKTDFAGLASSALSVLSKSLKQFGNLLKNVDLSGVISKGVSVITKVLNKVGAALDKVDLADITNKILRFVEIVLDVIDKLVDKVDVAKVIETIGKSFEELGKFISAAQQGFKVEGYEKFAKILDFVKKAFDWIGGFLDSLKSNNTLPRLFESGVATVKEFARVVGDAFTLVKPFFEGLLGKENSGTNTTSVDSGPFGWVGKLTDFLVGGLDTIREALSGLNLRDYQDDAYEFGVNVRNIAGKVWNAIQWAYEKIVYVFEKVKESGAIEWIWDKLKKAPDFLSDVFDKIKMVFGNIKSSVERSGILDVFKELFVAIFGDEKNANGSDKATIFDHVLTVLTFVLSKAKVILTIAGEFFSSIVGIFDGLGGGSNGRKSRKASALGNIMQSIDIFGKMVGSIIKMVFSIIMDLLESLREHPIETIKKGISVFFKIQWARLFAGMVSIVTGFANMLKGIGDLGTGFKYIGKGFNNIGKGIREAIGESWAEKIKMLAISLAIVAASIAILGHIPTDEMKRGAIAAGIIVAVLISITSIMTAISEWRRKHGKALDEDGADVGGFFSGIIDGVKNFVSNIGKILLLLVGMVALTKVLKTLASLIESREVDGVIKYDFTRLIASIVAMSLLIVGIAFAMKILGQADLAGDDFKKGLAILVTVKTIASAMKTIGKVMVSLKESEISPKEIIIFAATLSVGLLAIAGVIGLISMIYDQTDVDSKSMWAIAANIVAMCILLQSLASALRKVNEGFGRSGGYERTWAALGVLLAGIVVISLTIAAIAALLSQLSSSGVVGIIISSAVAIVAMSLSMIIIARALNNVAESIYKHGGSSEHWAAVATLLIPLAVMGALVIAVGSLVKTLAGIGSIAMFAVATAIITLAVGFIGFVITSMVAVLDKYYIDDVWSVTKSLIAAIATIGVFLLAVGTLVKTAGGIFSMLAASIAFAIVSFAIGSIGKVLKQLAGVYDELGPIRFDDLADKLQGLIITIGIILAAIELIAAIPTGGAWTSIIFIALGTMFVIFAAAVYILAKAATVLADAVNVIVTAIKRFSEIEEVESVIVYFITFLQKLGEVGSYFGKHIISIIGGVIALKLITPAISALGDALRSFNDIEPDVMIDVAEGLKALGTVAHGFGKNFFSMVFGAMALKVVAKACEASVDALNGFLDIIDRLSEATPEVIESALAKIQVACLGMIATVEVTILGILQAGINCIPKFTELVGLILASVALTIMEKAKWIAGAAVALIDEVLIAVDAHLPSIIASLRSIFNTIRDDFDKNSTIVKPFVTKVTNTFNYLKAKVEEIFAAIKLSWNGVWTFIKTGFINFGRLMAEPLNDLLNAWGNSDILGHDIAAQLGEKTQTWVDNLNAALNDTSDNLDDVATKYEDAVKKSQEFYDKLHAEPEESLYKPKKRTAEEIALLEMYAAQLAAADYNPALDDEEIDEHGRQIVKAVDKNIEAAQKTMEKDVPGLWDTIVNYMSDKIGSKTGGGSLIDMIFEKFGIEKGKSVMDYLGLNNGESLFDIESMLPSAEEIEKRLAGLTDGLEVPDFTKIFGEIDPTKMFGENGNPLDMMAMFGAENGFDLMQMYSDMGYDLSEEQIAGYLGFANTEEYRAMLEQQGATDADVYGGAYTNEILNVVGANQNGDVSNALSENIFNTSTMTAADNLGTYINDRLKEAAENFRTSLNSIITEIASKIESDFGSIKITPVLDLETYKAQLKEFSKLNEDSGVSTASVGIDTSKASKTARAILDGFNNSGQGVISNNVVNNYNLEQNNYSPTAPSSIDQYRQGRSLMGMLKGATA